MDSELMFVTKKHLTNSEGTNDGAIIIPRHKILMTSPSSSSESSIDSIYVEKDDRSDPLLQSKQANLDPKGVVVAPEVSGHNPSMSIHESSSAIYENQIPMQSGGYDPNRIPSSVFASNPATPMEWSVASNESLFSIHMGNNSFSRDHVFVLHKSGEIPKVEDTNNPTPSLPPTIVVQTLEKKIEDMSEDSKVTEEKPVKAVEPELPPDNTKAVPEETEKKISQEKASSAEDLRNSSSSTQSFQFPVFEAHAKGSDSVKVVKEKQPSKKQTKQEPHPQTPGTPPKPHGSSWFSCFSCCSRGC